MKRKVLALVILALLLLAQHTPLKFITKTAISWTFTGK